ncbi:Cd(II)/Pb(II)-responsive transcriptional regulator [Methylobacillus sp. Pita1]|uniref:Cd(II)/Pb(II)-responsive transcriptional regulator n=1 Tax=Methylobacillus sp. Pita1 TaxID=3382642 RepID=UPI0038B5BC72
MKIGQLSALTGCPVPTIRFFEAEGLLQAPLRETNNYRNYGDEHVARLLFVLRCRSLDMPHAEIRALLCLQDDPDRLCDAVNTLLDEQLRAIDQRLMELSTLHAQLRAIRSTCTGGVCIGECGALESLRRTAATADISTAIPHEDATSQAKRHKN